MVDPINKIYESTLPINKPFVVEKNIQGYLPDGRRIIETRLIEIESSTTPIG